MATTLYDLSVPVYIRALENLLHVLHKGEQYAKEKGIDPDTLAQARLAPDMNPLTFQIQSCSDVSRGTLARLGISELVSMEDNEKTYAQLYERIQKTIDILKAAKAEDFEGKEDKEVILPIPKSPLKFTGVSYLQVFALPNFFFHASTAYGILRKEGVPLGKQDYLGNIFAFKA